MAVSSLFFILFSDMLGSPKDLSELYLICANDSVSDTAKETYEEDWK